MRVGHLNVTRPEWYDRTPSVSLLSFNMSLAPHANTQRLSYTVPSGRKAYLEFLYLSLFRTAAAAPAGVVFLTFDYTPNGGLLTNLAVIDYGGNAVGDRVAEMVGSTFTMLVGDQLALFTSDSGTGGSVIYRLGVKITEFDAA